MSSQTNAIYAAKLAQFPLDAVKEAIAKLAETPRQEGETAFPDLGTVLNATRAVIASRAKSDADKKRNERYEKEFWEWVDFCIGDPRGFAYGLDEQTFLDTVRIAGYEGRKARNCHKTAN